jgi:hypothetical protein
MIQPRGLLVCLEFGRYHHRVTGLRIGRR